jgi:hypothetical protein
MMGIELPLAIVAVSGLGFTILHLVVWQFESIENRSVKLIGLLTFLSYALTSLGAAGVFDLSLGSHFWVSCPLYLLIMMLYLQYYMGIDRSVSIRILGEAVKTKGQILSISDLEKVYDKTNMIQSRLDLLVERGYLERKGEYYSCTAKGSSLARAGLISQNIYGLRTHKTN